MDGTDPGADDLDRTGALRLERPLNVGAIEVEFVPVADLNPGDVVGLSVVKGLLRAADFVKETAGRAHLLFDHRLVVLVADDPVGGCLLAPDKHIFEENVDDLLDGKPSCDEILEEDGDIGDDLPLLDAEAFAAG